MNVNREENTAENTVQERFFEKEFIALEITNKNKTCANFNRTTTTNLMHFHFCLEGSATLVFNENTYRLPLPEKKMLLLYNPIKNLPLNIKISPQTIIFSILISIKKFHSLFSEDALLIDFLNEENKHKKYYQESDITPAISTVLHQALYTNASHATKQLYIKGKTYELLSLIFGQFEDSSNEQCPFLADKDNIEKIRKAKEVITSNITEPPSLQELADQVDISLKKLKTGFKQVYGDTVFNFLFDYKMEYARNLLESKQYNVNEVSHKTGYSTTSHFIDAFKKRFGVTPKQYSKASLSSL